MHSRCMAVIEAKVQWGKQVGECLKRTVEMTKGPIVIAGGGLVGLSVAYNLAKRGAKDVFLFERHCIGAHHSTRVSTGMINNPNFYADRSLQSIVRKSHELYTELDEHGTLGFNRCGRVYLASSDHTAVQARRLFSRLGAEPANSAAELIDCPSEMLSRWPMLATEDVKLALFSPLDATVDVQSLCRLLTDRCRELGVHIHENVGVKRVLLNERRTTYAVDTDEGFIETGAFVNAAGIWANLVEVPELPDHQLEHHLSAALRRTNSPSENFLATGLTRM
uniref:DAO domain-containing protein n=1 Tax=Globodera pallida TaxID=36090 RepID=A0A183C2M5_GLOPA